MQLGTILLGYTSWARSPSVKYTFKQDQASIMSRGLGPVQALQV